MKSKRYKAAAIVGVITSLFVLMTFPLVAFYWHRYLSDRAAEEYFRKKEEIQNETIPKPVEYKTLSGNTFNSHKHGFSIDFPAGWEIKDSSLERTVIKASPPTSLRKGRMAFMSIAVYPGDGRFMALPDDRFSEAVLGSKIKWELVGSGAKTFPFGTIRWIKYANRSPAFASGLGKSYLWARGDDLYRASLGTDLDNAWFRLHEKPFDTALQHLSFILHQRLFLSTCVKNCDDHHLRRRPPNHWPSK